MRRLFAGGARLNRQSRGTTSTRGRPSVLGVASTARPRQGTGVSGWVGQGGERRGGVAPARLPRARAQRDRGRGTRQPRVGRGEGRDVVHPTGSGGCRGTCPHGAEKIKRLRGGGGDQGWRGGGAGLEGVCATRELSAGISLSSPRPTTRASRAGGSGGGWAKEPRRAEVRKRGGGGKRRRRDGHGKAEIGYGGGRKECGARVEGGEEGRRPSREWARRGGDGA